MSTYVKPTTIKLVSLMSGNRCAYPDCSALLCEPSTNADGAVVVGEIAHIHGEKPDAARYDPSMTDEERNGFDNLMFLCPNHHTIVDKQPNTYTVEVLRKYKADHEAFVQNTLSANITKVDFVELEIICAVILASPNDSNDDFVITDISEKMDKNGLSGQSRFLITLGLSKAKEVERFVEEMALVYQSYPERLKAGFTTEYRKLFHNEGLVGDDLFAAMYRFASNGSSDLARQAAGLSVLVYLFEKCEVFER